jgi:phosphoribosylformimino-5-aminoimidazole carboxamide ribonucleotide (ProFAR) isomerase
MLGGVNFDLINEVLSKTEIPIIASGGVTTIDDIEKLILLTKKGLSGVIIGKAIYESRIKIKDLIMLESRI